LVLLTALALLAGALWLVARLGTEFVPELEEGTINIRVTLAPSSSLDTALAVAAKLEPILTAFPEVTYASSRIGRAELGGDPEPVSNIEIYAGLLAGPGPAGAVRIPVAQVMALVEDAIGGAAAGQVIRGNERQTLDRGVLKTIGRWRRSSVFDGFQ
jgi:Cu/Ag efflux pump CusA